MLLSPSLTSINGIHRISKCINEFANLETQAKPVKWGGTLFSQTRFGLVAFIMDEPDEGHINNEEGVE